MNTRSPLKHSSSQKPRANEGAGGEDWYPLPAVRYHSDRDVLKMNSESYGESHNNDGDSTTLLKLLRDRMGITKKVVVQADTEEDYVSCSQPEPTTPRTPRAQVIDDSFTPTNSGFTTPVTRRNNTPGTGAMGLTDSPQSQWSGTPPPPQRTPVAKPVRSLPTTAYRVLDAPDIRTGSNQLLTWAGRDLAVPLGETIYIRNSSSGIVSELTEVEDVVSSLSYCNAVRTTLLAGHGAKITAIDMVYPEEPSVIRNEKSGNVTCLSSAMHVLACGTSDGEVAFYDTRSDVMLQSSNLHNSSSVSCVKWSPDERAIATADANGLLRVWCMRMRKQLMALQLDNTPVNDLSWSVQSVGRLAVVHNSGFNIYNTQLCKLSHTVPSATVLHGVNWAADLVTASGEASMSGGFPSQPYSINIYTGANLAHSASLTGHHSAVHHLTVSPDHRHLASGSGDETIRLWDLSNEKSKKPTSMATGIEAMGRVR
eukprot:TRINITY_DN390_c11_g1_i1.p1 TRINITY_DN390_c11_g1~~TRINITY_DN390_c11_g1_i1.p1  ORF type:complete len:509 (+),score=82.75 TRINITY_DN390_c11_g1_i1:82-1527(+)